MRRPSGEYSCLPAFGGGEHGDIHVYLIRTRIVGETRLGMAYVEYRSLPTRNECSTRHQSCALTLRNRGSTDMMKQGLCPKRLQVYAPAVLSKEAVLQTNTLCNGLNSAEKYMSGICRFVSVLPTLRFIGLCHLTSLFDRTFVELLDQPLPC